MASTGSVGLVLSPSFKDRTYIGMFKKNALLSFEGCVQVRVLAGVLEVDGRLITPSHTYHPLVSPMTNSRMVLTCLLPENGRHHRRSPDLEVHLSPFRKKHLTVADMELAGARLDLCDADIVLLDQLLCCNSWDGGHTCAVILLKELKNTLVDALNLHFFSAGLVFPSKDETLMKNNYFRIMGGLSKSLTVSEYYRQIAAAIVFSSTETSPKPIVLVCGKKNTGKSTLCRIITNSLLNSHSRVMFLECDVGQAEFTVPGVISLHCVTEPVYGPAYTHLRQPERAFFFGDNSPKMLPDFYLHLIKECMDYYRSNFSGVPLIVNTCGYTSGVGIPLFHDVTHIVKPSYIIQLRMNTTRDELPALTPAYLASAKGWSLRSSQTTQLQPAIKDIGLFTNVNMKALYTSKKRVCRPSSPIMISSDSEFQDSDSSDDEEDKRVDIESGDKSAKNATNGFQPPLSKVPKLDKSGEYNKGVVNEGEWSSGLHCKVCVVKVARIGPVYTRARYFRLLSYVAHFSPLLASLPVTSTLASSNDKIRENFIMAAIPYQVPWSAVAVHCIHRKVPSDQLLYALNGKFVALGRVSNEEIVDHGIIKFLKSSLPLIQYLGLGGCLGGMCTGTYDNPKWLREIVATKMPNRRCLGVGLGEIEVFTNQFNVRAVKFDKEIPEVIEGSEIVTEVIKKEYHNVTDQEEEDEVEIKGQRSSSQNSSRNYQLTIGNGSLKFNVGGPAGLPAGFFNIGGDGVGLQNQQANEIANDPTLGKEYSIMSKISIPPKTKLCVTITTYSCTFRLADVQVLISTERVPQLFLRAHLANHFFIRSSSCNVNPNDFLIRLCDPGTVNAVDNRVTGTTMAQLTYLGEETKVKKEVISCE